MDVSHALADLLPELTPTRMTLELVDRSITYPKGVTEDVFIKMGKFHFSTDFVVVDFEADARVPLILGRPFLRTDRALIDVYGEEITLRVNDEAVTFNLNQTTRYSSSYDDLSVNRIDIIDVASEKYAQEILSFSSNSSGGSPTSTFELILSDSSPSLTPFERSDFILEEIDAYLKDDSISPKIDHADFDPKGDICLIKKLLNNYPFQLPPMDLKEVIKAKSLIEEPPEVELKDLTSHLEYAYLEENDKLPKITDIKGIDPRFFTHKILMEEYFNPSVQSQRRDNPKIHEVIKKEVLKLLDAGMIYPISDSPWVSPIHCVPKKGGITMVANEENELIPTRSVTGWRVCIDYRKLNEATRKDHFLLPFMDQIPMTHLLEKETPFMFSKDCIDAFETLKKKLTEAPILVVPDWNLPFELMCDASDFVIGAVLGQRNFIVKRMSSQQKKIFFKDTSRLVEVSNRGLKRILERTVSENHASWLDKLDDALWEFRTAFKTLIGCDHWKLQLNELNELRDQAYENSWIYKERTKKLHDSKIKNRISMLVIECYSSTLVLRYSRESLKLAGQDLLPSSKFPYGTVELSQPVRENNEQK
nr:transposon Ty3-I Gag-Pol polyprotein [Tanacetum cinerariifolium]